MQLSKNNDEVLWSQLYRPKTVSECILPKQMKDVFQKFVDNKSVPNLLLEGSSGVGKTTVAMAMLDELGCDYMMINGSMSGNIDTLRNEIKEYATTMSFVGGRKYVILDESDYLNANSTQPALRNFMEEFSSNCGFILTANFGNRIIEPLRGRCSVVNFKIPPDEKQALLKEFLVRLMAILKDQEVAFEAKTVAVLASKFFPNFRRAINELQRYAATGAIDSGILVDTDTNIDELNTILKNTQFLEMRKWVAENSDMDFAELCVKLDKKLSETLQPDSVPQMVIHLNEFDYRSGFVTNREVNIATMLTFIMRDCNWR